MNTEQKLAELLQEIEDPASVAEIQSMQKQIRKHNVIANLMEHDGMKLLLKYYKNMIERIDYQLKENQTLMDEQNIATRQLLFHKKKWCKELIAFFAYSKARKQQIEKTVDNNL